MSDAWSDVGDAASMVGGAPARGNAIDQYRWGRAALHFAEISLGEHETLAKRLGSGAAGEVLLLAAFEKVRNQSATMADRQRSGDRRRRCCPLGLIPFRAC